MVLMAPSDENECRQMLYTATTLSGPSAVRYPRGIGNGGTPAVREMSAVPVGRGVVRREGQSGLAILVFGTLLHAVRPIADRLDATLVDMRFIKPLDVALVKQMAARHRAVITVEENAVQGGAGSAVAETLAEGGISLPLHLIGIPDRFIEHGSREDCLALAGLDAAGLAKQIDSWWQAQRNLSRTGT